MVSGAAAVNLVLDASVIGTQANPRHPHQYDATELMLRVARSHCVLLDHADFIYGEYARNAGDLFRQWWIRIHSRDDSGGVRRVAARVSAANERLLRASGFDSDDDAYIGTYLNGNGQLLVHEDSDFENVVVGNLGVVTYRIVNSLPHL